MSDEKMYFLLRGMHAKLNQLIESSGFDLSQDLVISYSKRLDKILMLYCRRQLR